MSFSSAKKRLLGSLYRKKKFKTSQQQDDDDIRHLPLLRSMSTISSNSPTMFVIEDPIGHLQSTTSLPDQLDKSEATAVETVSSKSLSSIDSLDPSLALYQLSQESTPSNNCTSRALFLHDFPATKLSPSGRDAVELGSGNEHSWHSHPQSQHADRGRQMAFLACSSDNTRSKTGCLSDPSLNTYCSNDTESNFTCFSNNIQSETEWPRDQRCTSCDSSVTDLATESATESPSVTCLQNEQTRKTLTLLEVASQCAWKVDKTSLNASSLDLDPQADFVHIQSSSWLADDFPGDGSLCMNASLSHTFSAQRHPNDSPDCDSRSLLSMYEVGDNEVFYSGESSNTIVQINEDHSNLSGKKLTNEQTFDQSHNSTDSPATYQNDDLKSGDGSIFNKIQFFESHIKNVNKTRDTNNEFILTEINCRNKMSDSNKEKDITESSSNNLGLYVFAGTDSAEVLASRSDLENPLQAALSSRSFSRSGVMRQRLNFSRFRRSDSIPEVVFACSCGESCDEECQGSLVCGGMSTPDKQPVGGGMSTPDKQPVGEGTGNSNKRPVDLSDENDNYIFNPSQVCHHPQCTEGNNDMPLMLCADCDLEIHESRLGTGHLVLDIKQKRGAAEMTVQKQPVNEVFSSPPPVTLPYNGETNGLAHLRDDIKAQSHGLPRLPGNQRKHPQKGVKVKNWKTKADKVDYNAQVSSNGLDSPLSTSRDSLTSELSVHRTSSMGSFAGLDGSESQTLSVARPYSLSDADTASVSSSLALSMSRKKLDNLGRNGSITLRFGASSSSEEDLVTLAATPRKRLWEAVGPVLEERQLDINSVNVFLEKSQTPLPLECLISHLADKTLEIKEKDPKELDPSILGTHPTGSILPRPRKGSKAAGRGSRRESMGLASLLLDAPPIRQRRGSLQLHFRDSIFTRAEARNQDGSKLNDDSPVNHQGRKLGSSTGEDDPLFSPSPAGSLATVKRTKSNKHSNRFGTTNKEKERQDQLQELLAKYSLQGLPVCQQWDESLFQVEPTWKLVVGNHESMTKRQHEHQEAVWELLHTEVSYIKQIRFIIDVFHNCLMSVKQESFLVQIESERLFSNIDKVFECNCLFWKHHLLPVLQLSRETQAPLDPLMFKDAFVDHFPVLFQVYFKYLIEQKSCLDYAKTCMDNSELFKIFIQWAETQKQCNRLRLADNLGQPMPRLLKYSLLLRAILKYTDKESDIADLQKMIQSVDKLCDAANSSVRRREEYERLAAFGNTIEPFDSLETPNDECAKIIQEYIGNFNLLAPIPDFRDGPRSLLFQSNLKMKEAQNVKMDVDCLLFTDLLLICKSNKKIERYKIVRPPMRLDHLVVSELKDKGSFLLIYVNEYNVPLSAFTFHSDAGAVRGWLDKFRQAQKEFKDNGLHQSFTENRFRSDTSPTQSDLDYTPMTSVPLHLDLPIIPRSDSVNSLEPFRPNHFATKEAPSQSELARSSSLVNFKIPISGLSPKSNGRRNVADFKLVLPLNKEYSSFGESKSCGSLIQGNDITKRADVNIFQSALVTKVSAVDKNSPTDLFTMSLDDSSVFLEPTETTNFEPFSNGLSSQLRNIGHSQSQQTLSQPSTTNESKLPGRPGSRRTDKRYRTADEIPEIKNSQNDTNMHEWSSLGVNGENVEARQFDSIAFSTDSLHSIPSSSGVSSTGSLHLPLETNDDGSEDTIDGIAFSDSCPTIVEHRKLFSVNDTADLPGGDDVDDGDGNKFFLPQSKHLKSKSTSDLVEVFQSSLRVSQVKDGIASVDLSTNGLHRKLTQQDILRLKKLRHQILSDANTESSEV